MDLHSNVTNYFLAIIVCHYLTQNFHRMLECIFLQEVISTAVATAITEKNDKNMSVCVCV